MTTTTAGTFAAPPMPYAFIRQVAQHRAISPQVMFRRLKWIGVLIGVALIGGIVALTLIALDVAMSEPAKFLTAFGFLAALVLIVAGAVSAGLLLWGGFISQYVAALDAKAQAAEAFDVDIEMGQPDPVQANTEIVRMVTDDALAIVEAIEQAVDNPRVPQARSVRAELASLRGKLEELECTLSAADHQRVFASLRQRYIRLHRARISMSWSVEEEERQQQIHRATVSTR